MSSDEYRFKKPPPRPTSDLLPAGDYAFTVMEAGEPYQKNNGHWVISLRLAVGPTKVSVFYSPWSGLDRNGEERDQIAEFLIAVNREPKEGERPNWQGLVGARGNAKFKVGRDNKGIERNEVHYVLTPKPLSTSSAEFEGLKEQQRKASEGEAKDQPEADDIPY